MTPDADALKEMAANRGLKLRRSRVRSPDKRGFNKFGLLNPSGAEVFGFKRGKPAAEAEEIASYLRGAEVQDWRASLKEMGVKRVRKATPPSGEMPPKAAEGSVTSAQYRSLGSTETSPREKLVLRPARKRDAEGLAQLFAALGHPIEPKAVAANLKALEKAGEPMIVAVIGKQLAGAIGSHATLNPHKAKPVGRITVLVVTEEARGRGIGRMLVQDTERRLFELGCGSIEVTSNDRLGEAHAFYKHLGYERTSIRFAKPLPSR